MKSPLTSPPHVERKSAERRMVFVELNEVNFSLAEKYLNSNSLPAFKSIIDEAIYRTTSEMEYNNLEPWIQWVSAHTGLTAEEHGVFRLGDITKSNSPQYIEILEDRGYSVGAISPMNTANRLQSPAYFIPDPWTATESDGSFWSRKIHQVLVQTVNENAKNNISFESIFLLALSLLRFAQPKNYILYASLAVRGLRRKWFRALFLDLFIHDLHMNLWRRKQPSYSSIFLNAGAHIQHHYMRNSKAVMPEEQTNPAWYIDQTEDPFRDMLVVYDRILSDYLALDPSIGVVVATGLTQEPYPETTFYWRLRDHASFLKRVGIAFSSVAPRMTRDFLVEFESIADAQRAKHTLREMVCAADGEQIFGEIEDRGLSLFVTLTYPKDASGGLLVRGIGESFDLGPELAFVAIKNGMHDSRGFLALRGDVSGRVCAEGHVKEINNLVLDHFLDRDAAATDEARL